MRALITLVVVLAAASAHALTLRAVEPFTVEGAFDLIIVPEPWNGGLAARSERPRRLLA